MRIIPKLHFKNNHEIIKTIYFVCIFHKKNNSKRVKPKYCAMSNITHTPTSRYILVRGNSQKYQFSFIISQFFLICNQ